MSKNTTNIIGVIIIISAYLFVWPPIHTLMKMKTLPNMTLSSIHGETTVFKGIEGLTVVYFWATWCQFCEKQMPDIIELDNAYNVVFISADSGPDQNVAAHLENFDFDGQFYVNDRNGELKTLFAVGGYPTTIVVKENKIQFHHMGVLDKTYFENTLKTL